MSRPWTLCFWGSQQKSCHFGQISSFLWGARWWEWWGRKGASHDRSSLISSRGTRWRRNACDKKSLEWYCFPKWHGTKGKHLPHPVYREGEGLLFIIDGGSCANVASKTLVDKLKLSVSPHPSPYTLQWLNQGKGLQISSRCLLGFSIGKSYKDEIWCDKPMDACHVLLGRPWLFDRSVMHDGRLNTYTFAKDHKKITLTPLKIKLTKKAPRHS